jgi:GT2 family glycosyltransferase
MEKTGECVISMNISSLIYDARNQLAAQALKAEADYILWLDSDMIVPPDVIPRMLKHMEAGKDFVSGIYFRRRAPFAPVLYSRIDREGHADFNDYPEDTVFEIAGAGFGCCMTRVSMLEDIALNFKDWFTPFNNYGEDLSFCLRALECGYKLYCDSTIKCGHVGTVVVDESVYKVNFREALLKNAGNN